MKHREKLTIGILAHVDAGKTTLAEAILYLTGSIRKLGRVDHGNAFLDTYSLEKARGITIFSKQAGFPLGDYDVTLLDTPGHVDFSADAAGLGLCHPDHQRGRRRAGTCPHVMASPGPVWNPGFSIHQ